MATYYFSTISSPSSSTHGGVVAAANKTANEKTIAYPTSPVIKSTASAGGFITGSPSTYNDKYWLDKDTADKFYSGKGEYSQYTPAGKHVVYWVSPCRTTSEVYNHGEANGSNGHYCSNDNYRKGLFSEVVANTVFATNVYFSTVKTILNKIKEDKLDSFQIYFKNLTKNTKKVYLICYVKTTSGNQIFLDLNSTNTTPASKLDTKAKYLTYCKTITLSSLNSTAITFNWASLYLRTYSSGLNGYIYFYLIDSDTTQASITNAIKYDGMSLQIHVSEPYKKWFGSQYTSNVLFHPVYAYNNTCKYIIKYYNEGSTCSSVTKTWYSGATPPTTAAYTFNPNPTNNGGHFTYWSTSAKGDQFAKDKNGNYINNPTLTAAVLSTYFGITSTTSSKTVSLYAINKYVSSANFYSSGTLSTTITSANIYGKNITGSATMPTLTNDKYEFRGWSTSTNATEVTYDANQSVYFSTLFNTTSQNQYKGYSKNLYAVWVPKEYTIIYNWKDDNYNSLSQTEKSEYNTNHNLLTINDNIYYPVLSWQTTSLGGENYYSQGSSFKLTDTSISTVIFNAIQPDRDAPIVEYNFNQGIDQSKNEKLIYTLNNVATYKYFGNLVPQEGKVYLQNKYLYKWICNKNSTIIPENVSSIIIPSSAAYSSTTGAWSKDSDKTIYTAQWGDKGNFFIKDENNKTCLGTLYGNNINSTTSIDSFIKLNKNSISTFTDTVSTCTVNKGLLGQQLPNIGDRKKDGFQLFGWCDSDKNLLASTSFIKDDSTIIYAAWILRNNNIFVKKPNTKDADGNDKVNISSGITYFSSGSGHLERI